MQDLFQSQAFQSIAGFNDFSVGDLGAGAQNRGQNFGVERAAYQLLDDEGEKTGMDALLTGNGGLAWGYVDPAWTGLQRIVPRDPGPAASVEPTYEPVLDDGVIEDFYYGPGGEKIPFLTRNQEDPGDAFGDYSDPYYNQY